MLVGHANYWAAKGWSVTIITCVPGIHSSFYPLHSDVKHVNIDFLEPSRGILDSVGKNFWRSRDLRKAIKDSKPECVISHLNVTNVRTLFSTLGLGIPVIVTEHIMPDRMDIGPLMSMLRWISYRWAAAVVAPNIRIIEALPSPIRQNGIEIFNPVCIEPGASAICRLELPGRKNIVSIGRLEKQKRFDLLLEAFAMAHLSEDCYLNIFGDGPLKNDLLDLSEKLMVADKVKFWGLVQAPWSVAGQADLFVMSSEFEGLPMVLLEAMSCGLAAVSFDCPVGPGQIITNGVDGILVPPLDVKTLADAISDLIHDDDHRSRLGKEAQKVARKFSLEAIMPQWENLVRRCSGLPEAV